MVAGNAGPPLPATVVAFSCFLPHHACPQPPRNTARSVGLPSPDLDVMPVTHGRVIVDRMNPLRVRVELADEPGALAGLTTALAGLGVDVASVDVLEVDGITVIDELVLRLPA